jgi:tRNA nucleotidyltransferase/poly(A) polymerase
MVLEAPGAVRWIVRTLQEAGYETWAVGGAIRNTLLNLPAGDWDLATRAPPREIQRVFPRTVPIGIEHGTVGVLTRAGDLLEVTTFRRDVQTDGRHAVVEFAETLEEDLARRDFTINAIAWHPIREEFRDPFNGARDLEARVLRTVGTARDRFAEDRLRVLRGLRFSGRFGLAIEETTWAALCEATSELGTLSPERVREELLKVLSGTREPSSTMALHDASGALDALYPELAGLRDRSRAGTGEDLLSHSFLLADVLPPGRPLLRTSALLHGLAGPGLGVDAVVALLVRLRFSNAEIGRVTGVIRAGLEPDLDLFEPPSIRRWLHGVGEEFVRDVFRVWIGKARLDLLRHDVAPERTLALIRRIRSELADRPPLTLDDLAFTGRHLIHMGLKPGPHFGEILAFLLDQVLADPDLNREAILRELVEEGLETGRFAT